MNKAFAVARWEYVEKVRSKAFLISLFLMPLIMIAMGVVPGLLASRPDTETKTIGILDRSGDVVQPLSVLLEERYKLPNGKPNYILRSLLEETRGNVSEAKKKGVALVADGEIEGYLITGESSLADTVMEYRSENVGNIRVIERLSSAMRDVVMEMKLRTRGLDPRLVKDLQTSVDIKTIKLSKSGEEEEAGFEKVFFSAYIFLMMMLFLVTTSGQLLVRSMLEEKSNRVIEVLMSSCSSNQLMTGKIIGLSGLGLTQLAFWAVIAVAVSLKFSVTLVAPYSGLLLFIYFILGYILYAAIFVAAGSPVSTEQEAQQLTSYLVLILVMPIVLALPVMQNPNSLMVKVLSYIPHLTPTMMAIRIPIQMPSAIEILTTILVLAASAAGAIWAAGKIFRTAILSYGKRLSVTEIVRLLRTS